MSNQYITIIDADDYFSKIAEPPIEYSIEVFDPSLEGFFSVSVISFEEYSSQISNVFRKDDFSMRDNPLLYSAVCTREHSFFYLSMHQNHSDFSFIKKPIRWCFDYSRFPEEALINYDVFNMYEAFLYYFFLMKCALLFPAYARNAAYLSLVEEWKTCYILARRSLVGRGVSVSVPAIYFCDVDDEVEVLPVEVVVEADVPRLHMISFEPIGRVDPIRTLNAAPTGWFPYQEVKFDSNGQIKLWISEVKFLLDVLEKGKYYDEVVYLGSSPGFHLEHLVKFFPMFKFVCYDPNFSVYIPTVEYGDMRNLAGRDWLGKRIVVISDIYSTRGLFDIVDKYLDSFVELGAVLIAVLEKQFVFFNKPHTSIRVDSEVIFEPFLNGSSGEMRSMSFSRVGVGTISSDVLESGQNFFRQRVRCASPKDPYLITKCGCTDCLFLSIEVDRLSVYTGRRREVFDSVRTMFWRYGRKGVYYSAIAPFSAGELSFEACLPEYISYYSQFGMADIRTFDGQAALYLDGVLVMTAELSYYPRASRIPRIDNVLVLPMRIFCHVGGGYSAAPPVVMKGGIPYVKLDKRLIPMNEANRLCKGCSKFGIVPSSAYCDIGLNVMDCGCTINIKSVNSVGGLARFAEYVTGGEIEFSADVPIT